MKNIENYLPMSAEKLIQEMGSFGNGKPTLDKALAAVPELPRLLTAPLEMILEEFNYRDNKNSRIAIACRVLAVLIFALNTGCRKGEILGLVWDRVDLKHGFIYLDKTKSGEPREIPINNTLREALQGIIRRIDSPFVFVNPETGGRYADLKRPFAAACRKAKIQDFRFHDLRHTFASQLVMAGVPLTTVSRLLGHASLTMTLRYSHLAPKHLQEAVDVLDRLQNRCPEVAPHSRRELKRTPLFHKEAQT